MKGKEKGNQLRRRREKAVKRGGEEPNAAMKKNDQSLKR